MVVFTSLNKDVICMFNLDSRNMALKELISQTDRYLGNTAQYTSVLVV